MFSELLPQLSNKLKSKKYSWLVTGGHGFIGSHVVNQLYLNNQIITIIDNDQTSLALNNLVKPYQKNKDAITHIKADLLDESLSSNWLQDNTSHNKIDFIIHLAANTSVPESMINPKKYLIDNHIMMVRIFEWAKEWEIPVVFASSAAVHGHSNYGYSKKMNEDLSRHYYNAFHVNSAGLRFYNVYGDGQNPQGDYASVIPKFIAHSIKYNSSKPVTIFGDGYQTRSFIHVDDLASIIILTALSNGIKNNFTDMDRIDDNIFEIGSSSSITINELYNIMKDNIKQFNCDVVHEPSRPGDIYLSEPFDQNDIFSAIGINKLEKTGISNKLKESLQSLYDWYSDNRKYLNI